MTVVHWVGCVHSGLLNKADSSFINRGNVTHKLTHQLYLVLLLLFGLSWSSEHLKMQLCLYYSNICKAKSVWLKRAVSANRLGPCPHPSILFQTHLIHVKESVKQVTLNLSSKILQWCEKHLFNIILMHDLHMRQWWQYNRK